LTARRPVPDALCSLATFNGAEGTGMAHLEAKVSAVLSAGRDLHREVSERARARERERVCV